MTSIAFLITIFGIVTDAETPPLPEISGTIEGVVVDGTNDDAPLVGVEVILRAGTSGEFLPVAETKSDRYGKFFFRQLPLDPEIVYLPGANRDGVHYPGKRVRLEANNRAAYAKIQSFQAIRTPSPLIAKRHSFEVIVEGESFKVTETLELMNPTRTTYVGESRGAMPPVTFWLSIPPNFDRVTFDKEFYGRRFLIVDHRPVTDIPWLPGARELRYIYHVPIAESGGKFLRRLDVPTSEVRVQVQGSDPDQISCNLPLENVRERQLAYASTGEQLPESFELEIAIGALPIPWLEYGRWGALLVLILIAALTVQWYRCQLLKLPASPGCIKDGQNHRRAA